MKNISAPLIGLTIYNAIQTIMVLAIIVLVTNNAAAIPWIVPGVMIVVLSNFFLFQKKTWAWILYLIWTLAVFVSFDFGSISWYLQYGLNFNLTLTLSTGTSAGYIGFDVISLVVLIFLLSSRKKLTS